jgi:ATP-dependent DNA helicase RecQ
MSDLIGKLQALLLDPSPNYAAFRTQIAEMQKNLSGEKLARSHTLIRLSLALQGLEEKRAGTSDIAVLLRQVIRAYNHRLRIKRELWQLLSSREEEIGLRVTDNTGPGAVELQATSWKPNWLPDTEYYEIDQLRQRRVDTPAVGTGLLYAMTRRTDRPFIHYQSEAQKIAVETSLFAPAGSITLITLPTGGGKSMCVVLPAWLESDGGRLKGGTTLVVVPTVSLAYDQEEQARSYFFDAADPEYKPHSLTSATPQDVRAIIRSGLRYGTLPILYTSPESLLNSELYQVCLEAARQGTINRFVIDEVHLVDTWGARFRTEFQLLASYRQKLREASRGQLRTLLLSATVSNSCRQTLEKLFGSDEEFFSMQANRLRPEISYWFNYASDQETRQVRVLETLRHLPRPAILYVTKPEDAEKWVEYLRSEGFERVAAFSGRTAPDERQRLINEWNRNQRDIMVATSAFGLGVDKSDVRVIIHAALPENVDRFYQEVGRGGRDGCSSVSLACLVNKDHQLALSMTTSARITTAKAWGRWLGMWRSAQSFQSRGDKWTINTNAVPDYDLEMEESQLNQEWNEHVLLLMQRAGIMSILDTRTENTERPHQLSEEAEAETSGWLVIQLLKPDAVTDPEDFCNTVERHRREERRTINNMLWQMNVLASNYTGVGSGSLPDLCLANQFADLYDPSGLACGGCPSCRHHGREPYADEPQVQLDTAEPHPSANYLSADFKQRIGHRRTLNLVWDEPRELGALTEFSDLLTDLVGVGIQQLILPTDLLEKRSWTTNLVERLAQHRRIPHRIIPDRWLLEDLPVNKLVYSVPTAILYPPDDERADQIYLVLTRWLAARSENIWLVNIVHRTLYLPSQYGKFLDRVDGIQETTQRLQESLRRLQTKLLF